MSKSQLFRLRIQKARGELELPWALQDWSYEAMKQEQNTLDALEENERLRKHAEAMAHEVARFTQTHAYHHEDDSVGYVVCCGGRFTHDKDCTAKAALDAYRADFPKEPR